jgi:hypothetical protein
MSFASNFSLKDLRKTVDGKKGKKEGGEEKEGREEKNRRNELVNSRVVKVQV